MMGLDIGSRTIGVAVSDELGITAQGLKTIKRRSMEEDLKEISEIISRFDRRIPDLYDERDRENGYIMGKSRQGVEMKFSLITISIAIVTNERRALSSPIEASEIAAELKDYAKTIPKSVFVIDKRRNA